ncbi:MAG: hypothetical protein K1Y02_25225 [Candidatus Hydrogenedentes bacterium]|nr:hypothetical protein [Candidatus Hydrogenedentota bacterium]
MKKVPLFIIYIAMVMLTVVSIWTTYVSVSESILPKPTIPVPLPNGTTYDCSIIALMLAVAIGLMLFALKMAIIDDSKRLNALGIIGLTVIGFISISFNLDVLYRVADRDFYLRYSDAEMRRPYEEFLSKSQAELLDRKDSALRVVAKQEGELQAEIEGLRKKPAGYGNEARKEDYALTLKRKESEVDLKSVEEALLIKKEADRLLAESVPATIDDIFALQDKLRVVLKDLSAASGVALPPPVRLENHLFAVFKKFSHFSEIGIKEVFFLLIAFFLDLGDIIGYSLVPNKSKKKSVATWSATPLQSGPEIILPSGAKSPVTVFSEGSALPSNEPAPFEDSMTGELEAPDEATGTIGSAAARRRRAVRLRKH